MWQLSLLPQIMVTLPAGRHNLHQSKQHRGAQHPSLSNGRYIQESCLWLYLIGTNICASQNWVPIFRASAYTYSRLIISIGASQSDLANCSYWVRFWQRSTWTGLEWIRDQIHSSPNYFRLSFFLVWLNTCLRRYSFALDPIRGDFGSSPRRSLASGYSGVSSVSTWNCTAATIQ